MKTLKQLRSDSGMTQKQVAFALGVSHDTINRWETGETYPSAPAAVKIAALYKTAMDEIDWEAVQIRTPEPGDQSLTVKDKSGKDMPQK